MPSPTIITILSAFFFKNVNWQYSLLDQQTLVQQSEKWDALKFSELSCRLQTIPPDTRFFPALLFQLLALALKYRGSEDEEILQCLKYKSDMSLADVANEYSDTGATLSILLGRDDLSKIAIQAGFLQTMFLKSRRMVMESWKSLGQTIEDVRQLNWHLDKTFQQNTTSRAGLLNLWDFKICRRT